MQCTESELARILKEKVHDSPYFQVKEIEVETIDDSGEFEAMVTIKHKHGEDGIKIYGIFDEKNVKLDYWEWHTSDPWDLYM